MTRSLPFVGRIALRGVVTALVVGWAATACTERPATGHGRAERARDVRETEVQVDVAPGTRLVGTLSLPASA